MAKWKHLMAFVITVLMCCLLGIGYAAVSGTLSISGTAEMSVPVYDCVVITDITTTSATTVSSETHRREAPTNVQTTVSGSAGQKIVYRITAHNYSETETYVYVGPRVDGAYSAVWNKMSVTVSSDANGNAPITVDPTLNYVTSVPLAPGEETVFYVTYTLTENIESETLMVNYAFESVKYTITYLNDNEVWTVDYIFDNSKIYNVRGPLEDPDRDFVDWVNANAVGVDSYPVGNTNSYTLVAKWDKFYLIMFVDKDGKVLYQETFTSSSTALSAAGQQEVNRILAELQAAALIDEMDVTWSDYTINGAKSDIVVRPVYTYHGNLQYKPVDEDGDGYVDYYKVIAVGQLDETVTIKGEINGRPVKIIEKLYDNSGNLDYSSGVKHIIVEHGVEGLLQNSLAYTEDMQTVVLPNSIQYIEGNAFSRNFGDDKKKITIQFNGTMAEWKEILADERSSKKEGKFQEWCGGLKTGTRVNCTDGYFELDRGFLGLGGYDWSEHKY